MFSELIPYAPTPSAKLYFMGRCCPPGRCLSLQVSRWTHCISQVPSSSDEITVSRSRSTGLEIPVHHSRLERGILLSVVLGQDAASSSFR